MKALFVALAVVTIGTVAMLGTLAYRVNKVGRMIRDAHALHARLDTYTKKGTG